MNSKQLEGLRLPGQLKLHYVGLVLSSIKESAGSFASSRGVTWNGDIVSGPKVRVTSLRELTSWSSGGGSQSRYFVVAACTPVL
jgi:hypothetical protein